MFVTVLFMESHGPLNYIACRTRPDLSHPVSAMSQYMKGYNSHHWKLVQRMLRYLKHTKHLGLTLGDKLRWKHSCKGIIFSQNPLTAYSDSIFANGIGCRSRFGIMTLFNGSPITWKSKKQSVIAQSTAEAEYNAASLCAKEVASIHSLLGEFRAIFYGPATIYIDSQKCIKLAEEEADTKRVRHLSSKIAL